MKNEYKVILATGESFYVYGDKFAGINTEGCHMISFEGKLVFITPNTTTIIVTGKTIPNGSPDKDI